MALTTKRIIALPSQTDPQEGDYLAIDNATSGTHKIPVGRIGVELDDTLTEAGKAADAKATGDAIDALRTQLEVTGTASGAIAHFSDGSTMPMKSCIVNIEPQQSGSGTPSPDNVRPISGWESVSVNVAGVNLWDEEWELGSYNSETGAKVNNTTRIRTTNKIPCKGGTTYYFKVGVNSTYGTMCYYDASETFISSYSFTGNATFTPPNNACYFAWTILNYGTTYNNDISINYPSTDTEYHAYNPNSSTTSVSLGRTVYGGEAEIVGGSLTDKMAMVDLGTLTWEMASAGIFYSQTIDNYKTVPNWSTVPNIICSWYQTTYGDAIANASIDKAIASYGAQNRVFVRDTTYSNTVDFKTAMSGVQLCYELANPQTYQLTPTEVKTLLGENNVWADSGDISVTYVRDLNIAINNLIGE